MKWIQSNDQYYWRRECGRYFVSRSLVYDRNPKGHWVHLASFKAAPDVDAVLISPERRDTFKQAAADCAAHIRAHRPPSSHQLSVRAALNP